MDLKKVNESFISECRELLEGIDSILQKMKEGGDNSSEAESIKMLFHAIHTIKRSASMYEFTSLESFTDNLERLLIKVKDGEVDFDNNLSDILLECKEHLTALVDLAELNNEPDEELLNTEKNFTLEYLHCCRQWMLSAAMLLFLKQLLQMKMSQVSQY